MNKLAPLKFVIYPSLMDSYRRMTEADGSEEREKRMGEFLAALNREPREPSMYAARGTALNLLLDSLLTGQLIDDSYEPLLHQFEATSDRYIDSITVDGFRFDFDVALEETIGDMIEEGMSAQVYTEAVIDTDHGAVQLYGYPDYIGMTEVVDLKTTASYQPGNYRDYWQRRVYPYTLVASGMMADIDSFRFVVAELATDRAGVIGGKVYDETYPVDIAESEREIRTFLDGELLPWMIDNNESINDRKVFAFRRKEEIR